MLSIFYSEYQTYSNIYCFIEDFVSSFYYSVYITTNNYYLVIQKETISKLIRLFETIRFKRPIFRMKK